MSQFKKVICQNITIIPRFIKATCLARRHRISRRSLTTNCRRFVILVAAVFTSDEVPESDSRVKRYKEKEEARDRSSWHTGEGMG